MASLRDLAGKVKELFSTAGSNLRAWGQVATQPQLRQDYSNYVVKPTTQRVVEYAKPILQKQYSPRVQINRIGSMGVFPESNELNAPYVPIREYLKPKSYLGGPAGKSIASLGEMALGAFAPQTGGIAQTGKVAFSLPNALKSGTALSSIPVAMNLLKGEKPQAKEIAPMFVLGAITGSTAVRQAKAKAILQSEPDIQNILMKVNRYDWLKPDDQIKTIGDIERVAMKVIPEVVKNQEMKNLRRVDLGQWMEVTARLIQDKWVSARNPELNFPLRIRELKGEPIKTKGTQPQEVGGKTKGRVFTDFDGRKRLDTNTSWHDLNSQEQKKAIDLMVKKTGDKEVLTWGKEQIDNYMGEISSNWDRKTGNALAWIKPKILSQPPEVGGVGVRGNLEAPSGRISAPPVKIATKPETQPVESILKPQLGGGKLPSGQGASSLNQTIDPIQKIINALKAAKPLEKQQGKIYTKIRGQQAGAIAGIGKNVPGEKGFYTQLGQLKGEMPKVEFESIRKQIGQTDIDSLFNKVEQANISPFEKITAKSGLAKLLGVEGGSVPVQSELELLNEIFPPEFIQAVLDKRTTMQKLFSLGVEALNIPRAIMATADMSAPLRQGVFLVGRPKQWVPAFGEQFKYFFSEKAYQGLADDIKARPTYKLMRENKLALTDLSPMLQNREETFMSNLVEKIPGLGSVTRASNRAYSGFLNKLRADVFDDLVKNAKSLGLDKERPEVMGDIARFVNAATGRGNLGALERSAPLLNGAFFSPRLMASRLNLLNPAFYIKLDPFVRKEALKSLFTFVGTGLSVLTLAKLGGAEVGDDPRSSDFGKIKVGNTRLDIWGGFQQYARATGQLISGKYVSSTTGKEYTVGEGYKPLTRLGILGRIIELKESPVASFLSQLLTGRSALGEKLDVPAEVIDRFIPMGISSMYDLYKEGGLKEVGLGLPSIFGVGVQTYGKQIPNMETTPAGKKTIKLKSVPGIAEDIMYKIRGTQPSNIPLEQQQGIVNQMQRETQKKIQLDKLKQDLESGKVPITQTGGEIDLDTAKLMFKYSSEKTTQVGNTFLYKDGDTIKTIDLTFPVKDYTPTGNAILDKEYLADYKGSIITAKNNVMKALKFGAITQDQAIAKLDELTTKTIKAKSGTKAKKGKKISVKGVVVPKFKITAPKTTNIKIKKPPKPKKITIGKNKISVKKVVYKIKKPKKITFKVSAKGILG